MQNIKSFSEQLSTLRQNAQLTNQELADDAHVPASLIAGLQSGKRRIGEYQARKIGKALNLTGADLESFIFNAINNCSEKKFTCDYLPQVDRSVNTANAETKDPAAINCRALIKTK